MSLTPPLSLVDVASYIRHHVFGVAEITDVPEAIARSSTGIELEWLTSYRRFEQRLTEVQAEAVVADLAALPGGSRITIEPGGQLELSSARFATLDDAIKATGDDLFHLDQACVHRRIDLIALGADPLRPPRRILRKPRYAAMEAYFDRDGRAGRTMMCNTASIQVNVGLGPEADVARRWRIANDIGPTLIATFANSPFADGGPSGWQSTRLRSWWTLDPSRSSPPSLDGDVVDRYIDYVLGARVMLMRRADDRYTALTTPLTFGRWLADGHELGGPTLDDLAYHLTTLFPPVRPRGWFEVRGFDALPTPFWQVAVAMTSALLTEPAAAADIARATATTRHLWIDAAQLGLGHPALHASAERLMAIALDVLAHAGHDPGIAELVGGYHDRWLARGRTPADDRLDAWRRDGALLPERESPVPYARELISEIDAS